MTFTVLELKGGYILSVDDDREDEIFTTEAKLIKAIRDLLAEGKDTTPAAAE